MVGAEASNNSIARGLAKGCTSASLEGGEDNTCQQTLKVAVEAVAPQVSGCTGSM